MSAIYAVVGDSQAEGLLLPGALPSVLGDKLVSGSHYRGWSTTRLVSEGKIRHSLDQLLGARPGGRVTSRVLVVVAGGNDTPPTTAEREASYRELLRGVVRTAEEVGVTLVWVGPVHALTSPDNAQHPLVAEAQRRAFAGTSARWIDARPLTRDLARTDNVHFTANNYAVFAERLVPFLRVSSSTWIWLAAAAVVAMFWHRGSRQ